MAETRKEYDFKIPVGLLRNLITEFQVFTRVHPTDLVFSQLTVRKQSIGYESRFNSEEFQEFLDEYSDADNSYIHLEYKVDQKNNKIVFSLNYQGPPEELPQKTKLTINLPNKGRVDKLFKEIDDFYNQKTRETILNSDDVAPNESTLPVDAEDVQTPQVSEELDASSESESEISNSINDTNGSPISGVEENTILVAEKLANDAESAEEVELFEGPQVTAYLKALADKPTTKDFLGFEDYARALVDFSISRRTEKPITIGIDAPWGMGKSSLMRMIEQELNRKNYQTVWFNAWKNDNAQDIWANIISEIFSQVSDRLGFWKKIKLIKQLRCSRLDKEQIFVRLVFVVLYFIILFFGGFTIIKIFWTEVTFMGLLNKIYEYPSSIGILAFFVILGSIIKFLWGTFNPFAIEINKVFRQPHYKNLQGSFSDFSRDFRTIIDAITYNGAFPLVIFIDDLDRASSNIVVETFEAINLLLDTEHCVFFVGMDSKIIAANIEVQYEEIKKKLNGASTDLSFGYKFIEKLIQINFHLPQADQEKLDVFVDRNLSASIHLTSSRDEEIQEAATLIREKMEITGSVEMAVDSVREENNIPESFLRYGKQEVITKDFEDSDDVEKAVKLVLPFLKSNPRLIKRFINLLRLKIHIAIRRDLIEENRINISNLARVILIEILYPEVLEDVSRLLEDFEILKQNQELSIIDGSDAVAYQNLIEDLSLSSLYNEEFFHELVMYIREHDLSDYLYLS